MNIEDPTKNNEWPPRELFTIRNIEGGQQLEIVEKVDAIVRQLREKIPGFIGISVLGSTFKGHALPQTDEDNSDLDICIIYKDTSDNEHVIRERVTDTFYDLEHEMEVKNEIEIQPISDINIAMLDKYKVVNHPGVYITGLVFPMFGNTHALEEATDTVRSIIKDLTDEEKITWAKKFARQVLMREFIEKPLERRGRDVESVEDQQTFKDKRLELYEERIIGLFIR